MVALLASAIVLLTSAPAAAAPVPVPTPRTGTASRTTPAFGVTRPRVTPSKLYVADRPAAITFTVQAARSLDLDVEIVSDRTGRVVRRISRRAVASGRTLHLRWSALRRNGEVVPDGRYRVRVIAPQIAARRRVGVLTVRGRIYPIRGRHNDRPGPVGRFGAVRNGGRTHEGFDVNAACGTRVVAARGGTVIRSRYDPVLYGNEVIVRGRYDGRTYRYAHLRDRPLVKKGDRVRTGQAIGRVGKTGNARTVGCHLHFELRNHRGRLIDPHPHLHRWDRYS